MATLSFLGRRRKSHSAVHVMIFANSHNDGIASRVLETDKEVFCVFLQTGSTDVAEIILGAG